MMRNRTAAVWLAGVLAMECAFGAGAAPAVILGESERRARLRRFPGRRRMKQKERLQTGSRTEPDR